MFGHFLHKILYSLGIEINNHLLKTLFSIAGWQILEHQWTVLNILINENKVVPSVFSVSQYEHLLLDDFSYSINSWFFLLTMLREPLIKFKAQLVTYNWISEPSEEIVFIMLVMRLRPYWYWNHPQILKRFLNHRKFYLSSLIF